MIRACLAFAACASLATAAAADEPPSPDDALPAPSTPPIVVVEPSASPPPAPAADPVLVAIQQTFAPESRAAGIATLERQWSTAADRDGARHALARALSWEGRLVDALAHYDALLAARKTPELVLERLQILSWAGRATEAEAGYRTLASSDPSSAAAHAGLARMRRWRGASLDALTAARRAVALAPADPSVREELAAVYAALGLPAAARRAIDGKAASSELAGAIDRAGSPKFSSAIIATTDSFDITRFGPRAKVTWWLPWDVRVDVGGGSTHLQRPGETLVYGVGALAMSVMRPRWQLAAGGAVYGGTDLLLGEGSATARARPNDQLTLSLGARRRPFLEVAEPLATDEAAFFAASSGGATTLAGIRRRGVDEVRAAANGSPVRGLYAYVDGRVMQVSDGNVGYSAAAGIGLDVLGMSTARPISLLLRGDGFAAGYRELRPDYFSPARIDGETLGGQLVIRTRRLTLSASGGATVSLARRGEYGWTAGGGLELRLNAVSLTARAEHRDDVAYAATRGWFSIVLSL